MPDNQTENITNEQQTKDTQELENNWEATGIKDSVNTNVENDESIRIAELEKTANQYRDQLLRKIAEFDNYKKRMENDSADRIRYANEDLIYELIPVLDDIERSLKSANERKDFETFLRGVELTHQKFIRILGVQGVHSYTAAGKPFDPNLHDALMQMPKADVPPQTVLEEVEKGYMMHNKVLRHAKVVVSSEPVEENPKEIIVEITSPDKSIKENA